MQKRLALWLCTLLGFSSPTYATLYSGTGTISILRTHDTAYGADVDWFSLVGVTSLGLCKADGAGNVLFRIRDDPKGQRMFVLALTAKASGAPLTVWVDDTVTDSLGYCYVRFIE